MNELKIFSNNDFGEIRTVTIDGEPWFVGKDVAEALGYRDTSDALKKHVDIEDKLTRRFADSGQNREMHIINESGLYSLILGSKLPTAKKFKRWVTSEVLPSIRKTGSYSVRTYGTKQTSAGEVASLLKVLERQQKAQGSTAQDIIRTTGMICEQFNIQLPSDFVKEPQFTQLSLLAVIE